MSISTAFRRTSPIQFSGPLSPGQVSGQVSEPVAGQVSRQGPAALRLLDTPPAALVSEATKIHGRDGTSVKALDGIDMRIPRGELTAIMGPSGSGKSTLLHCMAGLDSLTFGHILIGGIDLATLDDRKLTQLRRDRIGFVFQAFNLLPTLSAAENIKLPLSLAGRKADPEWFERIIDVVGLRDRLNHRPSELSGGQQQRVAAARALVTRPEIVLADEPTGNLDSRTGAELLAFLRLAVDEFCQTIVMVTHDPVAAAWSDRIVFLGDGRVVDEMVSPTAERAIDHMKRLGA